MSDVISTFLFLGHSFLFAVLLFVIPGYAFLLWVLDGQPLSWGARIGLSAGLSVAIYPLSYLGFNYVGLSPGAALAWAVPLLGTLALVWSTVRRRWPGDSKSTQCHGCDRFFLVVFIGIVLLIVVGRLVAIRGMIAPAWGDSVHHTIIAQLFRDNGGLFDSWSPYSPMESFTYHFGFHSCVAAWSWVTGMPMVDSVIIVGQVLNVLSVLALFPIAMRLGNSQWSGLGAIIVAGLLTITPAMYGNWGRYTQLSAQVILPGLLWTTDVWYGKRTRPSTRYLVLFAIAVAGLILSHYRVTAVAAVAVIAWTLWGIWAWRRQLASYAVRVLWLGGASLVGAAATLPWLVRVSQGRIYGLASNLATRSPSNPRLRGDLLVWTNATDYYPDLILILTLVALIVALRYRPKAGVPIALWCLLVFLFANPFLVGLPGSGTITNFLPLVGAYIPIALLVGFLFGLVWQALASIALGKIAIVASIVAVVFITYADNADIIDPFYQMVTSEDIAALSWVEKNVPADSRFLVNAFPAYHDSVAVGSDAGWWLPYYTRRATNVPPILYSTEALAPGIDRGDFVQLVFDIRASRGQGDALRNVMCRYGLSYVYLGDRQGSVGFGETQLLKPEWFENDADFQLLYQSGNAQVWSFDTSSCSNSE